MNQYPLVSVLMTSYNREKFLAEAIESVLASTYSNFELLIVDDGSKDATVSIARSYQEKDSRIAVYVNENNLGQFPNRNKAISLAKGEYVLFADSDDTLLPGGIENLVKVMQQFPSASFAMKYYSSEPVEPFLIEGKKAIQQHFFKKHFLLIGPGATFSKRSFFDTTKGYPVQYGAAGDLYYNLKACCFTDLLLVPFDFMTYRVHGDQELNNPYAYIYNYYLYLRDALNELPMGLSEKEIDWLRRKNSRRFFVNVVRYFFTTFNVSKTLYLLRVTKFRFKNLLEAIFN